MNATITTPHGAITATVDADQSDLVGTGYVRLTVDGESNCWDVNVVTLITN